MSIPKTPGVYVITHNDGREYIGSSKDVATRIRTHKCELRKGRHHSPTLQHSWNTHGPDAFTFSVLEECPSDVRLEREQFYIDTRKPYYNHAPVAGTTEGYKFTPQQRLNITKARGIPTYEYDGAERTLSDIAEIVGMPLQLLWRRIEQQGLTLEQAIARTLAESRTEALRKQWADPEKNKLRAENIGRARKGRVIAKRRKLYELDGKQVTAYDIAEMTGAPLHRIQGRLGLGMPAHLVVKYAAYKHLRQVPELADKYVEIARGNVRNRVQPVMSDKGRAIQRAAVIAYNQTRPISDAMRVKMSKAHRAKAARYDVAGESMSILEMSERWGVERTVIGHRIKTGWPVERAAKEPARTMRKRKEKV